MPRVYRTMLRDGTMPRIGRDRKSLGVVVEGEAPDLAPDSDGSVSPGTGGMSVAPAIGALPDHRIPKRLVSTHPRATGSNQLACWRMGEGAFDTGALNSELALNVDSPRHGTLQPAQRMPFSDYEFALAATQGDWVEDET